MRGSSAFVWRRLLWLMRKLKRTWTQRIDIVVGHLANKKGNRLCGLRFQFVVKQWCHSLKSISSSFFFMSSLGRRGCRSGWWNVCSPLIFDENFSMSLSFFLFFLHSYACGVANSTAFQPAAGTYVASLVGFGGVTFDYCGGVGYLWLLRWSWLPLITAEISFQIMQEVSGIPFFQREE